MTSPKMALAAFAVVASAAAADAAVVTLDFQSTIEGSFIPNPDAWGGTTVSEGFGDTTGFDAGEDVNVSLLFDLMQNSGSYTVTTIEDNDTATGFFDILRSEPGFIRPLQISATDFDDLSLPFRPKHLVGEYNLSTEPGDSIEDFFRNNINNDVVISGFSFGSPDNRVFINSSLNAQVQFAENHDLAPVSLGSTIGYLLAGGAALGLFANRRRRQDKALTA